MPKTVLISALALIVVVAVAMLLQHLHYAGARRDNVQDRQEAFYSGEAFHVLTFFKTSDGVDPIAAMRAFKKTTETGHGARWIYAGKVVVNVPSKQIGPVQWSAVALVQYPSREAYDAEARSEGYRAALAAFEQTYSQGARRSVAENLILPQILLVKKFLRAVTFAKSAYPFTPIAAKDLPPRGVQMLAQLRSAHEFGAKAAVIMNLQKKGDPAQRAADARYTGPMTDLMAERGYGPMHLASAVTLPGGESFDRVAIVYYPGTDYFADMFSSTFYQRILGDKQLDDNQSTITVPILNLL